MPAARDAPQGSEGFVMTDAHAQDFADSFDDEIGASGIAARALAFRVAHEAAAGSRRLALTHEVHELIRSEFDAALARHLRAASGRLTPAVAVVSRIENAAKAPPAHSAPPTLLDALIAIAAGAGAERGKAALVVEDGGGVRRDVETGPDALEAMRQARSALDAFGDPGLCRLSGDFRAIVAHAPDPAEPALFEADFTQGMIVFPAARGLAPARAPLAALDLAIREDPAVAAHLRRARDAVACARRHAVDEFRRRAETEIAEFDRSLAGRPLVGFRREIALELVARLKLAFGESLSGLSPHARLLAFDWTFGDPGDARGRDADRLLEGERPLAAE